MKKKRTWAQIKARQESRWRKANAAMDRTTAERVGKPISLGEALNIALDKINKARKPA